MVLQTAFQKELARMVMPTPDTAANVNIGWEYYSNFYGNNRVLHAFDSPNQAGQPERMDTIGTGSLIVFQSVTNLSGNIRTISNKLSDASSLSGIQILQFIMQKHEYPSGAGSGSYNLKTIDEKKFQFDYIAGESFNYQIKFSQRFK